MKRFLEGLGFEVKGEVCGCDIVAVDRGSPIALVICELKLSFALDLVLQPWTARRLATRFGSQSERRYAVVAANLTRGSRNFADCLDSGCCACSAPTGRRVGRAGAVAAKTQCGTPFEDP